MDSYSRTHYITYVFCFIIVAGIVLISILSSNSPLGSIFKYIGIAVIAICFFRPKLALLAIGGMAFSLDFLKKVAITTGSYYELSLKKEILAISFIAIFVTVLRTAHKLTREKRFFHTETNKIFLLCGVTCFFFFTQFPFFNAYGLQTVLNGGGFAILCLFIYAYIDNPAEIGKILDWTIFLGFIWAIWGIRQVYFGYSDLEIEYIKTGFSPISTSQYYTDILLRGAPRPCGFASGSPNYVGTIAELAPLALWRIKHTRFLWKKWMLTFFTVILYWAIFISGSRTGIIVSILLPLAYITVKRNKLFYPAIIVGMLALSISFIFNNIILANLENASLWLRKNIGATWDIQTYSDRLKSWNILKDPDSYSLFGLPQSTIEKIISRHEKIHDMISNVLLRFGLVPMLIMLITMTVLFFYIEHIRYSFLSVRNTMEGSLVFFIIAYLCITIPLGLIGGGNFHTVPINYLLWTKVGILFYLNIQLRQQQQKHDDFYLKPINFN